ncbi:hypothetical protein Ccar_10830 [Clostridium carboxidivorans P7]|uniref:Uncharacterized protein n=1 Tax=Clostridium carboxidivorans P7 TaxID=536227 RepID=C6PZ08_9CLOT|nr:hypothetical protein [Clostridium carboxidivorans]AKN31322.1 hypothetical protein Ccar_10830 [Clostridium carboxidivorans P7]EET85542.1 hypothetical protein CcarbDRAFT_4025 [Clostridium carboxidivorans P7]EFG88450.1 hypothetical protein CLCAR_2028 [Clostridium carboxidivorans P7]
MDNIIGKTISGFIMLIVIMGIMIFLPAWTPVYFQAWVYLLTFAVSTILITVYLFKNLLGYDEFCEKVRYHLIPFIW